VANGYEALFKNTTGNGNVASGFHALYSNTTGSYNSASGNSALYANTTGSNNVANGPVALSSNTTGYGNTADGNYGLKHNTTGNFNTALGDSADVSAGNLTNTTAIGYSAKVSANNNMVFGNSQVVGWGFGVAPGAAAIRVGTSTTNGNGATLTLSGVWTNASDISKKYDIENINYGLNEVMRLHPVTYKLNGSNNQDIGFIAQEVKKIIPEIVYGEEGEMTLSYGQITSVLTKAIQEQQKQIEGQQQIIAKQQAEIDNLKSLENEVSELKALVNTLVANQTGQGNK
jgi:hypothetical protein